MAIDGNCWFSEEFSDSFDRVVTALSRCGSAGRAINSYLLHQLEKALHGASWRFVSSHPCAVCIVPCVPCPLAEGLQNKVVCRALGVCGFSEQRSCRRPKLRWDWFTRDHILNSTSESGCGSCMKQLK